MQIDKTINKLNFATQNILTKNKNKLFQIENSFILKNPTEITKQRKEPFYKYVNKLEVLNPLLTLKRGYSIAKTKEKVITSVNDVEKGDEVEIEFNDGSINTKVI
jgi:exodeoxyribonuclease VII large subunit